MHYTPPTNASFWQAIVSDEDGYVTTIKDALDEYGYDSWVKVSVRRLSALPIAEDDDVWRLPGITTEGDIIAEWDLTIGGTHDADDHSHIEARLKQALKMAEGLNGGDPALLVKTPAGQLAEALHDLANKLVTYTGPMPVWTWLTFSMGGSHRKLDVDTVAAVDQLGALLIGKTGEPAKCLPNFWEHRVEQVVAGIRLKIDADIPPPVEEDPAVLREQIAQLKAQLATKGGAE